MLVNQGEEELLNHLPPRQLEQGVVVLTPVKFILEQASRCILVLLLVKSNLGGHPLLIYHRQHHQEAMVHRYGYFNPLSGETKERERERNVHIYKFGC